MSFERTPRAQYRKQQQQQCAHRAFAGAGRAAAPTPPTRPRTADGALAAPSPLTDPQPLSKEAEHAWKQLGLLPPSRPKAPHKSPSTNSLHRLARDAPEHAPTERLPLPAFRRKPVPSPVPPASTLARSTSSNLTIRPPPPPRTSSKVPPPIQTDSAWLQLHAVHAHEAQDAQHTQHRLQRQYHQDLQRHQQHQHHHQEPVARAHSPRWHRASPRSAHHSHSRSSLTDDSHASITPSDSFDFWDKHWSNSTAATDCSTAPPSVLASPTNTLPSYYTRSQHTPVLPSEPIFRSLENVAQVDQCLDQLDFPSVASESTDDVVEHSVFESDSEDDDDDKWQPFKSKTMDRVKEKFKLRGKTSRRALAGSTRG